MGDAPSRPLPDIHDKAGWLRWFKEQRAIEAQLQANGLADRRRKFLFE